ncbi:hypothetical protein QBC43DRAFT_292857 [Cladorrhinum sp. PSN259]|nr:hypothetical protein QBC43DRAFT_292857 [Cladorrhinum sp. PSN259]
MNLAKAAVAELSVYENGNVQAGQFNKNSDIFKRRFHLIEHLEPVQAVFNSILGDDNLDGNSKLRQVQFANFDLFGWCSTKPQLSSIVMYTTPSMPHNADQPSYIVVCPDLWKPELEYRDMKDIKCKDRCYEIPHPTKPIRRCDHNVRMSSIGESLLSELIYAASFIKDPPTLLVEYMRMKDPEGKIQVPVPDWDSYRTQQLAEGSGVEKIFWRANTYVWFAKEAYWTAKCKEETIAYKAPKEQKSGFPSKMKKPTSAEAVHGEL